MFDRGKQPEYEMDLENRFVAPEVTENDRDNELSLRPHTLEEYIGQEQVKENLSVFMQAARLRGEPLDHVLLYGPPGLGKTTLSQIIAAEMGVNIRITSGPAIEKPGDLAALLTNLNENDILFIDEIHRLNRSVEEVLYPAMEDYALDIIIGKGPSARSIRIDLPRFTLVGATTRAGQLSAPLRDRFGVVFRLELYTPEELSQIVTRSAGILGIPCEAEGAMELARRSRGTPRIANRFLRRVRENRMQQGRYTNQLSFQPASLSDHLSVFDDRPGKIASEAIYQHLHIGGIPNDDVGLLALFKGPYLVFQPDRACGVYGNGRQDLFRRHAIFYISHAHCQL